MAAFPAALPALIVSYTPGPGGAERILADHASALGPDTCVACPDGWLAGELRAQGLRVFPLRPRPLELHGRRAGAALDLGGHAREVRRLVANLRPRVVVAWGMRSALACAAARIGAPVVFQHNDLLPGGAVARAVRAAARRCDLVVALSEAIARDLGVGGVRVVHPGVNLERFTPGPGGPAALFLGALEPWKRPELAIEAAERAGLQLAVAGEAITSVEYAADLRRRAGRGITFAGRVEDPRPLLRDAACLIHCSDHEPFGLALVEALACGVPIVAPDAGGPREIVDESCGRLYPPGDAVAAAEAMTAVVAAREPLAAAARTRAERHFGLGESRRAWARAIEPAAAPAGPRPGAGIAVVTVLHDSRPEVERLMDSLERHLPGARLVAVDSGSADTGAQAVRDRGGTVIDLGENAGYGRGTNAGVAAVGEPVVVIANPDVELLDSSIAALAAEARASGRILAPLVVQPDGRREPSAHPEPGSAADWAAAIAPAPVVSRPSDADEPRRVTWAAGCCLVARTDVLRGLGPFDERAFLYAEDMDLGLRAADAGVETWFHPEARVLHARAHSTERAFGGEPFDLLARRRREVVLERRGARRQSLDDAAQALTFATRIALKSALRRPTGRERARLRALRDARRG